MKFCQRIAWALLSLYFLIHATVALGENPKPQPCIQPIYTVKVIVDLGRSADLGTGSLIRRDLVITANHVVEAHNRGKVYVEFLGELRLDAKVIKQAKAQDLALLEIDSVLFPTVPVSDVDPKKGDSISIMGFAHGTQFMSLRSKLYKWYDFSEKGVGGETAFSVKGSCISGMSGGPALSGGILVGTLTGTDDKESYCPNATKINKFLKGFDLAKYDGMIEVE